MFTEQEIQLVRSTWEPVSADPDAAAALFYGRLFETAPAVKPLFTGDMNEQGRKLMKMINLAVQSMDKIDEIVPALQALGKKHVAWGAQDAHYPVVGEVLIGTLAAALGDDFSDEARAAWIKTYGALASVMTSE
jgi:hemoglobin-like flavoprotein